MTVLEPGGDTAFRSHSNSNMLIHPARDRYGALQFAAALQENGLPALTELNLAMNK